MSDDDRWTYYRDHDHPMGWGVRDNRDGTVVAYGDKNIAFTVSEILNGRPDPGVLKDWTRYYDMARPR